MRFLVLSLVAFLGAPLLAQSTPPPPELLADAGHCLATADGDWLGIARDSPYAIDLGYLSSEGSNSDSGTFYLIEFTTPTHSRGFAFAFQARGRGSHRELTLEYRTGFQQTEDGTQRVSLIDPPLGGLRSEDEILAAIRQVGFHTWKVPVADLRDRSRSVSCATAQAVR